MKPGKSASLGDIYMTVKSISPTSCNAPSPRPPLPPSLPPLFQFDFQSQVLSSIQHGTRTKKVEFTDITGYTSEVSDYLGGLVIISYSKYTYFVVFMFLWPSWTISNYFSLYACSTFTNKQYVLKVDACCIHTNLLTSKFSL